MTLGSNKTVRHNLQKLWKKKKKKKSLYLPTLVKFKGYENI